ncbi:Extracellular serine protease [Pandoraea cepalis]|uniref:Extracellular serine protease n=1 Tax=Pandoraea cepalis TaxID=2508294 RepID=A0A5E4YWN6_9BURK|nr:autotransporter outer membrane beta-barrel domain-containing protein [Pandoraea cepalis]VVE52520.1 Extracellular serine protease [Pandoraea cepalis]
MQKNHPKSNALRQTKICMAVAAVVTAAALPGYAVASDAVSPQVPQWQAERNNSIKVLGEKRGAIVLAKESNFRANLELKNNQEIANIASALRDAVGAEGSNADKFSAFRAVMPHIEKAKSDLDGRRGLDGDLSVLDKKHHAALTDLAAAVRSIDNESKLTSGAKRNALNSLIDKRTHDAAVTTAQDAATKAQQNLTLLNHKLASLSAVGNAEDSARLASTYLLDVNADSADTNAKQLMSWGDANLKAFANQAAVGAGDAQTKIVKGATLEIGGFSGRASDAIHGAAELASVKTREIGTLRALEGAEHQVGVVGGALNVNQAIEGSGKLAVLVGADGKLNFSDKGVGIADDAANVTLMAGKFGAGNGAAGHIAFGEKTSAGNAKIEVIDGGGLTFDRASAATATIALRNGGELTFAEGSTAGASTISVGRAFSQAELDALPEVTGLAKRDPSIAAKVTFDGASVGDAIIANGGTLTVAASNLRTATITNDVTGMATISGKLVDVLDADGQPAVDSKGVPTKQMLKSLGGAAKVTNHGTLKIQDTDLQDMALINASGNASISTSEGGNAIVANVDGATLSFTATQLEQMHLTNSGIVNMADGVTAHQAKIDMVADGVLDISKVSVTHADGDPDKTLSIGSLTGTGAIYTGDTALVLGALNGDDRFAGSISHGAPPAPVDVEAGQTSETLRMASDATLDDAAPLTAKVVRVAKVGTGNLTLAGDQSGVSILNVDGGTVTAAHANALGSGTVNVASASTVSLNTNVSGVKHLQNDGTVDLGMNRLEVGTYASDAGATIKSRVEKVEGDLVGGQIHVTQIGDFSNTKLDVAVADDIEVSDLLGNFQVVTSEENAAVLGGEVTVGSITGGKQPDPTITDPKDPTDPTTGTGIETTITEKNLVKFLAADGGYSANERAVLASVDGVTVGDLASGKIGGKVLSAMALQTAGSEEQRRSARLLSGESLVNNATAAQGAATSFQRGMQTRMIAGGSMFDDTTANGAMASDNGIAGWASFKGGNASQRGDGMSFDVKGLDGAIGIDKRVGQNTLVGASVGLGNQDSKAKGMPGESKVNSVSVGLYGSHLAATNWFVNGGVSYTNHSVKTDRTVAARNASARLSGKTSGQTFGMFGEVGKRFGVSGVNIDPSVGVRVASTRLNAFDETNRDGQGTDGLKVGSQSQTSTRGVVGVRLWREVASIAGGKVAPSLRLSYEHEFGNTQSSLTNAIYGAPSGFTVKGPKLGRDIFTADLGVDMQMKKQLEVRVGGNVSVRKGESALGGGISAKYRF